MNFTQNKFYKPFLLGLCVVLLLGVSQVQRALNQDREKLGLTRMAPLENTPPVLAFTTVALGGFRGLIANALWIRLNDLQENDKFFEMVQLADWITKLEPHFAEVWNIQAWNMAYNISVKFKDPEDRWRWVQRGIELLRDEGLRFNPDETMLYWQLSWIFQHKMGHNLDDAHLLYKRAWIEEMTQALGEKPDYEALLNPKTDEARQRVKILREKYKLEPQIMKKVDDLYGPLEWRLPDAHAVYWAVVGQEKGKKENQERLLRSIYQSMQAAFRRGAIYKNKFSGTFTLGPNLDNLEHVNASYEAPMSSEDKEIQEQPAVGHKNFLKDAVYFLYLYNRQAEAVKWFDYLKKKYPHAIPDYIQDMKSRFPGAEIPADLTLDQYAIARVTDDVKETDVDRITAVVGGLLQQSFFELIQNEDDRAANYANMAQSVWNRFQTEIKGAEKRIALPPLKEIRQRLLDSLLDPEKGLPPEAAAVLRTKLGLPAQLPASNDKASK